jgi:CelD/BcsL family acetyltransferase involved in cellulose biosynthesis
MEENRVFTRPGYESYVNDFFAQVTKHAILEDMHESMKNVPGTVFHEDSYSLDLSPYATIDEYLSQAWTGNHGKQFRKHIRHIEHDGVVLQDGTIDDLDLLFDFNIVRFGNESSFIVRPFWKEFHRDIAKQFNTKITIVKREEETIAVGLSLIYNTKYYGITSGWNSPITNLGKFLLVKKIDEAIHLKASTFEAGTGDYGWKELFGLAKHPLYLKETK